MKKLLLLGAMVCALGMMTAGGHPRRGAGVAEPLTDVSDTMALRK